MLLIDDIPKDMYGLLTIGGKKTHLIEAGMFLPNYFIDFLLFVSEILRQ